MGMIKAIKGFIDKTLTQKVDTTPDSFNAYFRQKISTGVKLRGRYYCITVVGEKGVPGIGKDFKVWGSYEKAERKRKTLQYENPNLRLEVKVASIYYIRED